jgi:hypothetical protein
MIDEGAFGDRSFEANDLSTGACQKDGRDGAHAVSLGSVGVAEDVNGVGVDRFILLRQRTKHGWHFIAEADVSAVANDVSGEKYGSGAFALHNLVEPF